MDKEFECPHECPFQADDGKLAMALAVAKRVTLPIVTCAIVAFYYNSITTKEDRAINQQEAIGGIVALFLAYQPTLMDEAVRQAIKKHLQ